MLAWPSGLAFFYPLTRVALGRGLVAGLILAAITVACVWRVRRQPYLLVGWLWFVGTLVPVIGFVQVGQQDRADRFLYVPAVGVFVAVVWGVADLLASARAPRWIAAAAATGVLAIAAAGTVAQAQSWRDGDALFQRCLVVTTDNYVAHMNPGHLESKRGRWALAEQHYREAARINPTLAVAWASLSTSIWRRTTPTPRPTSRTRSRSTRRRRATRSASSSRSGDAPAARAASEALAARPATSPPARRVTCSRTGDLMGALRGVAARRHRPDDVALAHASGSRYSRRATRGARPAASARAQGPRTLRWPTPSGQPA
jgi:hypothetical protein